MESKRLIDYYPPFIAELREINLLSNTLQLKVDDVNNKLDDILNNQFVQDANEDGIKKYEEMLGIVNKPGETLDDRRFKLKAKINEQLPYTYTMLKNNLATLCGSDGYTIELWPEQYKIAVMVELKSKNNFNEVKSMLGRILPCNLVYTVGLIYNQHITLKPYQHSQLNKWTHSHIRNEVLQNVETNYKL